MKLDNIVKDPDIYPRVQVSHKTIQSYVEALKARAKFPAILVQGISSDDKVETIALDGWHRVEAYKEYNKINGVEPIEEIKVTHWKEEVLDKKEWLERLRIVSTQHNLIHGDRLGERDLEFQGLKIVSDRPIDKLVGIEKELAGEWGVSEGYISQLVGDEVKRRKQSRDALAYSLHLLGWTQVEIAWVVGLAHTETEAPGVSKILKNFNSKLFQEEYQSGLSPEQIATNHNLTQALVWAILLQGKDDLERFKLFGKGEYGDDQPKIPDYWKFAKGDPRLGMASYEGNLYGQEVLNIIYRYTRQGDLVVDPMAGGGVTLDACLVMGRRCRAYDKDPRRKDIMPRDLILEGFPIRANRCHLIILDPPYYKKKEAEYNSSEFSKDRETFINNMVKVAEESYKALHPGGCVALLYGQYINYESELNSILSSDLCRIFEERFRCVLRIQSPLTFDIQYQPFAVERAKSFTPWRILPVSKDWQIFKKVVFKETR